MSLAINIAVDLLIVIVGSIEWIIVIKAILRAERETQAYEGSVS